MFTTIPFNYDLEPKTKNGLDKLELMVRFISVIEAEASKGKTEFTRMKSWLVQQLKRGLTPQEEIALAEGILKYLQSEPMTNERTDAMQFLFEAKFLNDELNVAKV